MRSPMKPTSPCPKKMRRSRAGISRALIACKNLSQSNTYQHPMTQLSMSDVLLKPDETRALRKFREAVDDYIMLLKMVCDTNPDLMIDFHIFFSLVNNLGVIGKSNVIYYKVLDERCDDNLTLLSVINELYNEFIVTKKQSTVLLEGDQATYERLKAEYGSDLSWCIPFPGDWHFLKNYQEVLVKIYFDAGLVDLGNPQFHDFKL